MKHTWYKRVGWFLFIWSASVATLVLFAYLFRLLMSLAGLTTH